MFLYQTFLDFAGSNIERKMWDSAKCKIYTKPCIVWNRNRHENWYNLRLSDTSSLAIYIQMQTRQVLANYHWRELPQVSFLSRQMFCHDKHVFVARKNVFCRIKSMLAAMKVLSRQNFCRDKYSSWQARVCRAKCFVATSILLSRQKGYLWQLPPTLTCFLQQLMLKYKIDQRPIVHFQLELALL